MRTLRLAVIALATATTSLYVSADTDILNIKMRNGSQAHCRLSEIAEVSFDEREEAPETIIIRGYEAVD